LGFLHRQSCRVMQTGRCAGLPQAAWGLDKSTGKEQWITLESQSACCLSRRGWRSGQAPSGLRSGRGGRGSGPGCACAGKDIRREQQQRAHVLRDGRGRRPAGPRRGGGRVPRGRRPAGGLPRGRRPPVAAAEPQRRLRQVLLLLPQPAVDAGLGRRRVARLLVRLHVGAARARGARGRGAAGSAARRGRERLRAGNLST